MKHSKNYIEMRIKKLENNHIENNKLIKKWQRKLKKVN